MILDWEVDDGDVDEDSFYDDDVNEGDRSADDEGDGFFESTLCCVCETSLDDGETDIGGFTIHGKAVCAECNVEYPYVLGL